MKKLGVKDRIIETASRLFYFNGYNQTGINQIIEEANVAKASMYQHFRSKEDIAVAYLQRRHAAWMNALRESVADKADAKEKIYASFDYLKQWLKEVDYRGCGWQNIVTDLPEGQQKIKDQAVYHKGEVRTWIRELLETEYDGPQGLELADEVMVLLEGAIISAQIQRKDWPIDSGKRAVVKLLEV